MDKTRVEPQPFAAGRSHHQRKHCCSRFRGQVRLKVDGWQMTIPFATGKARLVGPAYPVDGAVTDLWIIALLQIADERNCQRTAFGTLKDLVLQEKGILATLHDGDTLLRASRSNHQLGATGCLCLISRSGHHGDGIVTSLTLAGGDVKPVGRAGRSPAGRCTETDSTLLVDNGIELYG